MPLPTEKTHFTVLFTLLFCSVLALPQNQLNQTVTIFESKGINESTKIVPAAIVKAEDESSLENDYNSDSDEERELRIKEPGFGTPKPIPKPTTPATTPQDLKVREEWGGNCLAKDWEACTNISSWGGDYIVREKYKPFTTTLHHFEVHCDWTELFCLRNGWTVSRCHMVCMGRCNKGKKEILSIPDEMTNVWIGLTILLKFQIILFNGNVLSAKMDHVL